MDAGSAQGTSVDQGASAARGQDADEEGGYRAEFPARGGADAARGTGAGAEPRPEESDSGEEYTPGSSTSGEESGWDEEDGLEMLAEANVALPDAPMPSSDVSRKIGVALTPAEFCANIDDFVAFTFAVNYNLCRDALTDDLLQTSRLLVFRTPYKLHSFLKGSVHIHEAFVDACSGGCVAFIGPRQDATTCDACSEPRYKPNGKPAKQVVYWQIEPWLRMMVADPVVGPEMVRSMSKAPLAAWQELQGVRDWYDGRNFRAAVAVGHFPSDFSVAWSLSTDGFEAWRQNGFQVCVTPGPKQPVDLESFLHPIAEELNKLARGISEVVGADSRD